MDDETEKRRKDIIESVDKPETTESLTSKVEDMTEQHGDKLAEMGISNEDIELGLELVKPEIEKYLAQNAEQGEFLKGIYNKTVQTEKNTETINKNVKKLFMAITDLTNAVKRLEKTVIKISNQG